jgi:sugar phosphate isomerase/epimerase
VTPISIQLYSLRDASAHDFDAVLKKIAAIGYLGVEPFNLYGKTPREFRTQVEDLGMTVSSSHTPWANRAPLQEVVETLGELGLKRAISGFNPDDFKDLDSVRRTADNCLTLIEALEPFGIELALHNHWWEFEPIDDRPAYHHFQDLVPTVFFELDTYWAANFGACNPADELARVSDRAPLVHIKDGPLVQNQANVSVGSGAMDIPAVLNAADSDALEWIIVELDACETDMMTAVEDSFRYLTTEQLARGRTQQ